MEEELLLSPEITVHEEPGHITIDSQAVVSVEVDEADLPAPVRGRHQQRFMQQQQQYPFPNGDIPAEISITKVTGRNRPPSSNGGGPIRAVMHQPPRPRLKVRDDLGMAAAASHVAAAGMPSPFFPPGALQHEAAPPMPHRRQQQQFGGGGGPPPLTKGSGLPPMPRLRFGGPRIQRQAPHTPLADLMSMQQHHPMMQHPYRGMRPPPPQPKRAQQHPTLLQQQLHQQQFMHSNMGNGGGGGAFMGGSHFLPPAAYGMQQQSPVSRQQQQQHILQQQQQQRRHHHSSAPSPSPRSSPTVINVNSPDYPSKLAMATRVGDVPPPLCSPGAAAGFPPPMMRPGAGSGLPSTARQNQKQRGSAQVRTVLVPPPMKISQQRHQQQQQQHMQVSPNSNGYQQQFLKHQQQQQQLRHYQAQQQLEEEQQEEEQEIDDDEESGAVGMMQEEEELDDVEPDVDPNNEVDDVEPENEEDDAVTAAAMAALREQEALIRSIDKHQVTVSITPKNSGGAVTPKPPPAPDTVSVTATNPAMVVAATAAAPAPSPTKVQYVRRPDGKGFMRKVIDSNTMNLIRAKKKKKKKAFRGINYRFDGTRIKKRTAKRTQQQQEQREEEDNGHQGGQEDGEGAVPPRDPAFLEYLGIQRKDSTDSKVSWAGSGESVAANLKSAKAKKSFKSGHLPGNSGISSMDDADSGTPAALKRRLSLSDVLISQKKKVRQSTASSAASSSNQQTVRHRFGGVSKNQATAAAALKTAAAAAVAASTSFFSDPRNDDEKQPIAGPLPPPHTLLATATATPSQPLPRLRQRKAGQSNSSSSSSPSSSPSVKPSPRELLPPAPPLQPCVCPCATDDGDLEAAPSAASASGSVVTTCQAVESVGTKRVGCNNKVEEARLKRKIGGGGEEEQDEALLCPDHVRRLKGHNICPFCREFCAHGLFFMCRSHKRAPPHLFHKHCYLRQDKSVRRCPHCHSTEQPLVVQLKLEMARVPLELLQVSSKMSFPQPRSQDLKAKSKTDKILAREDRAAVTYKLPDGKVISSEGLPEGISNEALEKVIEAVRDKQSATKHTTRNMYGPVKAGDNVKILQMLSMGYSPIQRFPECEGGTPLHVAASEGHILTMHILVQAGAELDTMDEEQNTALMLACIKGRSQAAKYLLQAGADVTQIGDDGMTCLHLATQSGFLECAHVILSQSHLPRNFLNLQDDGGWTPLVWACENKHEPVIRYLLERGANPLITDVEGNITLHWAALSGSRTTCEMLLNAGCEVNATNTIGETPIHIALRQDHYECTLLFLMRGARLDIKNNKQQTPVDCMAKESESPECGSILKLATTLQDIMQESKSVSAVGGQRWERIVSNDVSKGKESAPIQVVNEVDGALEPQGYVYVAKNCVTNAVPLDANISKMQHCKCNDSCSSEDTCHCSDLSVRSWYDSQGQLKDDFDFKDPPMLFECNDMCSCHVSTCYNRVVQHGITARLQIYRTDGMGWGVRALADIPKGAFVCEYVGEVISDSEADTREDSYLFDLDNRDGDTFCLDANKYGNIARFINHSCAPNLVPVKVFAQHQDLRFPHIALFASREIPRGQELGFDYGEKFWVIKHKYFTCCCGTDKCRYNRSSIQGFLREYYHRMGEPMPEELLSKKAMAEPSKSSVNAAKSEGAAKKAAAASSSGEKAEKDTPSTTKDCSKKDQVVAAGDEAGPKKASKKSDKTPSRSATPNANVPAPAPAPDDAQVASEQKRKTSESGPDAPLVVVKKEVLEGKEASEDAASEDGGGGGDAKKIGRPRRAVTKKAEENAGPAGGGSANSVSASSK